MDNPQNISKSGIPSNYLQVLRNVIGRRLVSVTRYSWWSAEEAEEECGIKGEDVFSLTAGPVSLEFDSGIVLGIASDPSINSVCVWIEADSDGKVLRSEPLHKDGDLYPISASDMEFASNFWHDVIGREVKEISVLVRKPSSLLFAELPNEVGLSFLLDSGATVVAAHGLHDDSDDFAIISRQSILPSVNSELKEVFLGE